MHFKSTHNDAKVFYTLDELLIAQAEAKATGDASKIAEVFDLTWVDCTSTNNFENG